MGQFRYILNVTAFFLEVEDFPRHTWEFIVSRIMTVGDLYAERTTLDICVHKGMKNKEPIVNYIVGALSI